MFSPHSLRRRKAPAAAAGPRLARARLAGYEAAVLLAPLLSLLLGARAVSDAALHARAVVVDAHSDCTQRMTYDGVDLAKPQPDMQVDLAEDEAGRPRRAVLLDLRRPVADASRRATSPRRCEQFDAVHAHDPRQPEARSPGRGPRPTSGGTRGAASLSALFGVEGGARAPAR